MSSFSLKTVNLCILMASFTIVGCGKGERTVTLITPFTVIQKNLNPISQLQQPGSNLSNAVLGNGAGLSEPTELPGALSSSLYCYQTGIRLEYFDQRQGYPPRFERVNLVTLRDMSNSTWVSPFYGPVGLNDAMSWIKDETKSFLASPLVVNVPRDSGGIIRIQGYFLHPMGGPGYALDPKCPVLSSGAGAYPNQTFTLWGEATLAPGGPLSLSLPVNVVSSQPAAPLPSPYSTPTISGASITNPPGDGLKCRNTTDKRTCMNRNLLEVKLEAGFTHENQFTLSYGAPSSEGIIEQKFSVTAFGNHKEVLHIPKNPVFNLTYKIGNPPSVSHNVRVDWVNKRYQFFNVPGTPPLSDLPLSSCSNSPGKWGLRAPTASPVTAGPSTDCSLSGTGGVNQPNIVITDLGFGFY
jgi:hypothetical protein